MLNCASQNLHNDFAADYTLCLTQDKYRNKCFALVVASFGNFQCQSDVWEITNQMIKIVDWRRVGDKLSKP